MDYPAREFDKYLLEKIVKHHRTAHALFRSGALQLAQLAHQKATEIEEVRDKFFKLFKRDLI